MIVLPAAGMRRFARQFTTIGMAGWPLLTEVDPRAGMLAAPVVVVVADIGADPILPVIVDCCVVGTSQACCSLSWRPIECQGVARLIANHLHLTIVKSAPEVRLLCPALALFPAGHSATPVFVDGNGLLGFGEESRNGIGARTPRPRVPWRNELADEASALLCFRGSLPCG